MTNRPGAADEDDSIINRFGPHTPVVERRFVTVRALRQRQRRRDTGTDADDLDNVVKMSIGAQSFVHTVNRMIDIEMLTSSGGVHRCRNEGVIEYITYCS